MLLSADENKDHAKLAEIKILNKHNFYVHDYIMITMSSLSLALSTLTAQILQKNATFTGSSK